MSLDPVVFFKCLAEETRLKSLLLINQCGEACVCDLVVALQLEQPKISRHLAELRRCELVLDERRGKWVYYRLQPEMPQWAKAVLDQTLSANLNFIHQAQQRLNVAQASNTLCTP